MFRCTRSFVVLLGSALFLSAALVGCSDDTPAVVAATDVEGGTDQGDVLLQDGTGDAAVGDGVAIDVSQLDTTDTDTNGDEFGPPDIHQDADASDTDIHVPAKCVSDADCADKNPCTFDTCDPKAQVCSNSILAGQACDDGSACTTGDVCGKDGTCGGATQLACDDTNTCTDDACDPTTGKCVFKPASHPCDDGNLCTLGDKCESGACSGGANTLCDDKNACTSDACSPTTGKCEHTALNAGACSDGDACTSGDTCVAGACAGSAIGCDDNNACTLDSCDKTSGTCTNAAIPNCGAACTADVQCDDGNPCTKDTCLNGICGQTPTDGGVCDDGNPCTTDGCAGGLCVGKAISCDDSNPCTTDACDPSSGACVHPAGADNVPCDDGSACTLADGCKAGKCVGGSPKSCDDSNACTTDVCDPKTAACSSTLTPQCGGTCAVDADCNDSNASTSDLCVAGKCVSKSADGGACSDGNGCTTGDTCFGGACQAGSQVACDDGNPCTLDQCDVAQGKCVGTPGNEGAACTDGNNCTITDVCTKGSCIGQVLTCNDNNACTNDACNPSTGICAYANIPNCQGNCGGGGGGGGGPGGGFGCNDNNVCTKDACVNNKCEHTFVTGACTDNNLCTTNETCVTGVCVSSPVKCDDGNPCTSELCNPVTGACVVTATKAALPCTDGDACTITDTCAGGLCIGADPVNCDDGDGCTADTCDAASGKCAHKAIPGCGGNCVTAADCNDNNPCTGEACTAGKCATSFLDGAACNDGNVCTVSETCQAATCGNGKPVTCDDGNACTTDTCNPKDGACAHALLPGGTACDDGDKCTTGDACSSTICIGIAVNCDDGDACTLDTCSAANGTCSHSAINNCGNNCQGGGGGPGPGGNQCNDNNPCTADACVQGKCEHTVNDGGNCNTGSACKVNGTCVAGVCEGSLPADCDDGNTCTTDLCQQTGGGGGPGGGGGGHTCGHAVTIDGTTCSDGLACTAADACKSGQCVGTAKTCDDGNACTADSCDSQTGGCVSAAIAGCGKACATTADCSDGNSCTTDSCTAGACAYLALDATTCSDNNLCTANDTCVAGQCVTGITVLCDDANPCTNGACDAATGLCAFTPANDGGTCDDGAVCTTGDACKAGKCAGAAVVCNDNNPCTTDSCYTGGPGGGGGGPGNPGLTAGSCQFQNIPGCTQCLITGVCNDNNACTADACVNGACQYTALADGITCTDGQACTILDQCTAGKCAGTAKTCDDGNSCTKDTCQTSTGACTNQKITGCGAGCLVTTDCTDNNPCTLDICNTFTGGCVYQTLQNCVATPECTVNADCNDSNPCTNDVCNPSNSSCAHVAIPGCNPNAICATDADCNDNNACTVDACNTFNKACVHVALPGCN